MLFLQVYLSFWLIQRNRSFTFLLLFWAFFPSHFGLHCFSEVSLPSVWMLACHVTDHHVSLTNFASFFSSPFSFILFFLLSLLLGLLKYLRKSSWSSSWYSYLTPVSALPPEKESSVIESSPGTRDCSCPERHLGASLTSRWWPERPAVSPQPYFFHFNLFRNSIPNKIR